MHQKAQSKFLNVDDLCMSPDKAIFIHDTWHIIEVNQAACDLFRCDREALIDLDMMELLYSPDFRGLARLRMTMLRENKILPPIKYQFLRYDGSVFWATVLTNILFDGDFETTLNYEYEE